MNTQKSAALLSSQRTQKGPGPCSRSLALALTALLSLAGGACATAQRPQRTVLSSTDAFTTARKLILRAHRDPRLEGVRRSLQQVNGLVELSFTRNHGEGRDQIEVTFLDDESGGTMVHLSSKHLGSFGQPGVCSESVGLESSLVALLTTSDPDLERQMGTMLVSSDR